MINIFNDSLGFKTNNYYWQVIFISALLRPALNPGEKRARLAFGTARSTNLVDSLEHFLQPTLTNRHFF
jgi:hypothetical protein